MSQQSLSSPEYWTERYKGAGTVVGGWSPADYNSLALEHILLKGIKACSPKSILEIGCGGSTWLPYLGKRTGASVAGIDYSELGCQLSRQNLEAERVQGKIFCIDFFDADPLQVGQYDFVYSLGVAEHFVSLETALAAMMRFVRPGGVLFTSIPNLRSFHGLLGKIWQPAVMEKHQIVTKGKLVKAYGSVGLMDIVSNYCGLFSLNIVAWGVEPRFPKIEKICLPFIYRLIGATDVILRRLKGFDKANAFFSPFVYIYGTYIPPNVPRDNDGRTV
jgi:SAM-dependent methyltransferase